MIAIVNTGGANLASVVHAFARLKPEERPTLTSDPNIIAQASKVILPGVGAAFSAMEALKAVPGLIDTIRSLQQPVLGICLGMQLLFEFSEEGQTECLGIISGQVKSLPKNPLYRVPHMGWNNLEAVQPSHPLLRGIPLNSANFYFVHSYVVADGPSTVARAQHGNSFPAVVQKNNFYGVQFHPERSGSDGAQILKNFLELE